MMIGQHLFHIVLEIILYLNLRVHKFAQINILIKASTIGQVNPFKKNIDLL